MWTPIFFFFYTSVLQSWQNCGQLKLAFKLKPEYEWVSWRKNCAGHWQLRLFMHTECCFAIWYRICCVMGFGKVISLRNFVWIQPCFCRTSMATKRDLFWPRIRLHLIKNAITTTQITKSINSSPHTLKTAFDEIWNGQDLPVSDTHESVIIYSHKL